MNESNDELLESLMKEYQRLDLPSASLVASVDRGQRRLVREMAVGVGVTVLLCTVGLVRVILRPTPSNFIFAFMEVGFPVVAMAFWFWARRNSWSARAVSTRAFLVLERERRRAEIRSNVFVMGAVPVLVVLTFLFQALLIHEKPELIPGLWRPNIASFLGFGGPYMIVMGILVHSLRKRRRLSQQEADLGKRIVALDSD